MKFEKENQLIFLFFISQDIVDILQGWYIEPLPTDRILEYTAQELQTFRPFQIEQSQLTTLTLLDYFIEDADNYAQGNENGYEQKEKKFACFFYSYRNLNIIKQNDEEDIVSFTDKFVALYREIFRRKVETCDEDNRLANNSKYVLYYDFHRISPGL